MRTDRITWFLDSAHRCAIQGTCLRRRFGAVIVDDNNTIISTGYNGAPVGQKDCLEHGFCWREENNIKSGTAYEKCKSVHAEQNAIIQAGKKARKCTLYLTGIDVKSGKCVHVLPCFLCSKMILNAGISKVIIKTEDDVYKTWDPQKIYDMRHKEAFS